MAFDPHVPSPGYDALALPLLLAAFSGFASDVAPAAVTCRDAWSDADVWKYMVHVLGPERFDRHGRRLGGATPLHSAAGAGDAARVRWLVERGAPPDTVDYEGFTPMLRAIRGSRPSVALLEALLGGGADPGRVTQLQLTRENTTPLMEAARLPRSDLAFCLLDAGADPRQALPNGGTALHAATQGGSLPLVLRLLDAGIDVNAWCGPGNPHWTALLGAAAHADVDVVTALIRAGAELNVVGGLPTQRFCTPLIVASQRGHIGVVTALLEAGADARLALEDGRTALHAAARAGSLGAVKALLAAGASPNAWVGEEGGWMAPDDPDEFDPDDLLEDEMAENWSPIFGALASCQLNVVTALLDAGAELNVEGRPPYEEESGIDSRATPLMLACRYRASVQLVPALLERGADPKQSVTGGRTALHEAARAGFTEVVKLLLDKGVEVDAVQDDNWGNNWTPLGLACEFGHSGTVRLLLKAGASTSVVGQGEGVDGAEYPSPPSTPLMSASRGCHMDVVSFLLSAGADVRQTAGVGGRTALHDAARGGDSLLIHSLLSRGALVDAWHNVEDHRATPLLEAAAFNNVDAALALMSAGADVSAEGSSLRVDRTITSRLFTCLMAASRWDNVLLMQELIDSGVRPQHAVAGGRTALHAAAQGGSCAAVIKLLGEGGVAVDAWEDEDAWARRHWTPLMAAAQCAPSYSVCDVARALIAAGAAVNAEGAGDGRHSKTFTPLMAAARRGIAPLVKLLLEAGADARVVAAEGGETPLHAVAAGGSREAAVLILAAGGDPAAVDAAGKTPAAIAGAARHGVVAALLRQRLRERQPPA